MKLSGRRNQCAGCGKYFNSDGAFDMHRAVDHKDNGRFCLTEEQMLEKGMTLGKDGFWRGEKFDEESFGRIKNGKE